MTIDEAIIKHIQIADSYHKAMPNYDEAADHRQLAEWLMELKEAKRLLKAAVEDFAVYGALKDLSTEQRIKNPDWQRFNRVFDILDHQWRYADEVMKLIGEDSDNKFEQE